MPDEQLGLRERKKLDTRKALSDAALELAFERGLANVTRDDIAARAGVSVRTFNNYFTGKHEALVYRQIERVKRSLAILRDRPADEPLWTSIRMAVVEPLEADGAGLAPPRPEQLAMIRDLLDAPETRIALSRGIFDDWAEVIAERTGTDPVHDLYPRLVAGVLGAIYQSTTETYTHADPPVLITTLLRQAIDGVAAGLPAPATD
ncbi:TetR family transcriptional regulator [Nocardia sp. NBC_00565]|uniref:TetR/AcrR family transcriptional regulator n=1 Tax=Nocardia sp. NBC_00565 TaxID=2975993 RepID=UPI002E813A41|nr:TetR family transcriptional regulator [Nocardia sp. NBC_00565]WUC04550.1 TetR family transcriptional regulator [Nocardia sp. NBC_00565]